MTKLHIGALGIAAVVLLACVLSQRCGDDRMHEVLDFSKYIAIATFAHAGALKSKSILAKKKSPKPKEPT